MGRLPQHIWGLFFNKLYSNNEKNLQTGFIWTTQSSATQKGPDLQKLRQKKITAATWSKWHFCKIWLFCKGRTAQNKRSVTWRHKSITDISFFFYFNITLIHYHLSLSQKHDFYWTLHCIYKWHKNDTLLDNLLTSGLHETWQTISDGKLYCPFNHCQMLVTVSLLSVTVSTTFQIHIFS